MARLMCQPPMIHCYRQTHGVHCGGRVLIESLYAWEMRRAITHSQSYKFLVPLWLGTVC